MYLTCVSSKLCEFISVACMSKVLGDFWVGSGSCWGQRCWWAGGWRGSGARQSSETDSSRTNWVAPNHRRQIISISPSPPFSSSSYYNLPYKLLETLPSNILSAPSQCFYSASNKLWFRSMAIPSWFHQFSVTLDGGNGLIWFPHFSTQPPTHTYTSPPSLTLQYPISVHRPLQKKPVQQRIFSQNPGLLCHSHVWLCHSQWFPCMAPAGSSHQPSSTCISDWPAQASMTASLAAQVHPHLWLDLLWLPCLLCGQTKASVKMSNF